MITVFLKNKNNISTENLESAEKKYFPSVSYIIAAYNEEDIIEDKIKNALNIDYPKDKLQIIIVSDGSNDSTPQIASSYEEVISLHQDLRQGKTAALNRAIKISDGEIITFSDANSMFRPDALKKLVRNFIDKNVGGVCGRKSVIDDSKRAAGAGDNLFWHIESFIKSIESKLGSIPTADGEIFAIRKRLYTEVPNFVINDDMAITFNLIQKGHRVIYEKDAITEEEASISHKEDFNVKARMVYGGLQIMNLYKDILNPFKSAYALRFFIHKTLRYFMWALLISIYISNYFIVKNSSFYFSFFLLQNIFYTLAFLGHYAEKFKLGSKVLYFPYYYCNVNIAALKGFFFYLRNESGVSIWSKAQR